MLRKEKVVGKFVEFFGEGTASLSLPDRATIGNMAPEYGATMGFFPVDEKTINYFKGTGRTDAEISAFENYFQRAEFVRRAEGRRYRLYEDVDARPRHRGAVARRSEASAGSHRNWQREVELHRTVLESRQR